MRVLVVEDEPRLLRNLSRTLREEGYAVDTSDTGVEGLYKAQTFGYDAIILDVMLPGMNGWDLLSELRTTKQTPVLMLTARDSSEDRVRGLDGGADDYLVKPFDLPELLARLRALIRRSNHHSTTVIDLGNIAINTKSKSVHLEGSHVNLTAREYAIVEFLALHQDEVISRTELYEHLFDENDDTMSNLVDVHIFSIRKKLGHDLIATRRGQGYCIESRSAEGGR